MTLLQYFMTIYIVALLLASIVFKWSPNLFKQRHFIYFLIVIIDCAMCNVDVDFEFVWHTLTQTNRQTRSCAIRKIDEKKIISNTDQHQNKKKDQHHLMIYDDEMKEKTQRLSENRN